MQHLIIENKEYVIIDNIMIAHTDVSILNYHDGVLYCSLLKNFYNDWRLPTFDDCHIISTYLTKYYDHSYSWTLTNAAEDRALAFFNGDYDKDLHNQYSMMGYTHNRLSCIPVRNILNNNEN